MAIEEKIASYKAENRKKLKSILWIWLGIGLLFIVSLSASETKIGLLEGAEFLVKRIMGVEPVGFYEILRDRTVCDENIPRALGAIMAGAVLAIGGAALQNLIRNPLADPYTLGISSGAMFGMVIAVALGISIFPFLSDGDSMMVNAFFFAMIPTIIVLFISAFKKVTPTTMILCGIAVMYIFTAFTTMIKYTVESETLSMIYQWSIGSVSGLSWGSMPKFLAASLIAFIPMFYLRERIDIVAQSDNQALCLGVNPNRLRIVSLTVVSLATAIVVCYTGTIGFVGLVAPHIARIFVGSKMKLLLPASASVGALMVLGCDVLLRKISPNLPVGVLLALVCSPIFIYILIKMSKRAWRYNEDRIPG